MKRVTYSNHEYKASTHYECDHCGCIGFGKGFMEKHEKEGCRYNPDHPEHKSCHTCEHYFWYAWYDEGGGKYESEWRAKTYCKKFPISEADSRFNLCYEPNLTKPCDYWELDNEYKK
jgi:hypothetical protein